MLPVVVHADKLQRFIDAPPDFTRGNPKIFRPESHVFFNCGSNNLVVGILKTIPTVCLICQWFTASPVKGRLPINGRMSVEEGVKMLGQC